MVAGPGISLDKKPAYDDPAMNLPWPQAEVGRTGPVDIDYIEQACKAVAKLTDESMVEVLLRHRAAMVKQMPPPGSKPKRFKAVAVQEHLAKVDDLLDRYDWTS